MRIKLEMYLKLPYLLKFSVQFIPTGDRKFRRVDSNARRSFLHQPCHII